MPAHRGNTYAKNNRGGGRKSLKNEIAEISDLHDIWTGKLSKKKLEKKVESGKCGIYHVFALEAYNGNMRAINKVIDKLFANQTENRHQIESNDIVIDPLDIQELLDV